MNGQQWYLPNEQTSNRWAAGLAQALPKEFFFVALSGGLGAGKTHTVRAVLRALGEQGAVRSPTYTLLEEYVLAQHRVIHMDLYRLASADELEFLGLRDYVDQAVALFVEWPDKAAQALPPVDLHINLAIDPNAGRLASVRAASPQGASCLKNWLEKFPARSPDCR